MIFHEKKNPTSRPTPLHRILEFLVLIFIGVFQFFNPKTCFNQQQQHHQTPERKLIEKNPKKKKPRYEILDMNEKS